MEIVRHASTLKGVYKRTKPHVVLREEHLGYQTLDVRSLDFENEQQRRLETRLD